MKTVSFSDLPFLRYRGPPPAEICFRTYLEQLIAGLQSQFRAEFAYIPFLDYIDLADSKNQDRFIFRTTVSEILGAPPPSEIGFRTSLEQLMIGKQFSRGRE